ncbi:MAG: YdcF family protein [Alphaproteobacteria bacterium]
MFFSISKIAWAIVDPSNLVAIVLVAATVCLLVKRYRAARRIMGTLVLFLAAITLLPIPSLLVAPLEQRFSRPDPMPDHVDGIILLGGAQNPRMTRAYGTPALGGAANTMTTFLWLARTYPDAKLVFTGGVGSLRPDTPPEAETARLFLIQQGFDPERVLFEDKARNTAENAAFAKALAEPKPGEVWLLVAQAIHMPRAVGTLRRIGWEVVPYPESYRIERTVRFEPASSVGQALAMLGAALHEWIGLAAYYVSGRSDRLLPGP